MSYINYYKNINHESENISEQSKSKSDNFESILKIERERNEEKEQQYKETINILKREIENLKNISKNKEIEELKNEIGNYKQVVQHFEELNKCPICLTVLSHASENYFVAFPPCGHRICNQCEAKVEGRNCPVCNGLIYGAFRIY